MHRDLKPENFLFGNKETAPLKAIDFGLSVFFKLGERFNEIVGSPYYMAPEVLKHNYGPEVDVWSAGVILYNLPGGIPPLCAEIEQGVAQATIHSVIDFKWDPWPKVSGNATDFVKKMLNPDSKQHLTAQEVLEHPWLLNAKKAHNVPLDETEKARLKQVSVMNKFKKRALRVIAEHSLVEEVVGIKEAFEIMDTGKRSKINLEELQIGLQKLGQQIPNADLQILVEAAKVNGEGTLNYGEFVAVSVRLKRIANGEHLHKAFAFFNLNKSGYLEIRYQDSLNDEVDTSSEKVINAIIYDVDTDKDERIRYEEFVARMKAGIIDPLKVIKTTLVDAVSVTSLITTEAVVVELLKAEKDVPAMLGGIIIKWTYVESSCATVYEIVLAAKNTTTIVKALGIAASEIFKLSSLRTRMFLRMGYCHRSFLNVSCWHLLLAK